MDYDGGEYGLGILSKHPILRSESHRLPDGAEPRCALEIEVDFILVPRGSPRGKLVSEMIYDRLTSDHRPVLA